MEKETMTFNQNEPISIIPQVERSKWHCYLFGTDPMIGDGFIYNPAIGEVPNVFIRCMMKICLGCTWVKRK